MIVSEMTERLLDPAALDAKMHGKADSQKRQSNKNCSAIHLPIPFLWSFQPYQARPMPNNMPSSLAGLTFDDTP